TNEMLRSVIGWEKLEEPVQIVLKQKEIPIRVFDLSDQDKQTQKTSQETIINSDKNQPLDLSREPFRITLCRGHDHESLMILTFHHILLDGWSTGILLTEFRMVYNRLVKGESSVPITKTRYKEFFKWYRQCQSRYTQERQQFWKNYLEDFDTRTLLPYDKKKLHDIQQVSTHKIEISSSCWDRLQACALSHNVTISTILYAAWGILLQRYNNSHDIVFGTTVSGRTPLIKGIEQIVGLFINTLPLRLNAGKDTTVSGLFLAMDNHLKERNESKYEHSPLTEIKQLTGVGRESNLFDSLIVIDNYPLDNLLTRHTPGTHLVFRSYDTFEMTNFDLTVQMMMLEADHMRVDFHYDADLFEPGTIKRMANHYVNILQGMISDASVRTADLPMLTDEETKQILEEFNNPAVELLVEQTIAGVISDQAVRTPFNHAVQYEDCCLTYQELNRQARRLTHMLKEHGVGPGSDSRVAVMFPRSLEMIIALLGILKAGAVCIPLDISYPQERNRFIIRDSKAGFLLKPALAESSISSMSSLLFLTGTMNTGKIPGITEIFYDAGKLQAYSEEDPGDPAAPADLSYIIYTSGSTGKPKGALLHHSGIVNHTYTKIQVLGITGTDTVANNFSINVIASVWQILSPLFTGGRLVLYTEAIEWDPYLQFQRAEADGVTVIEVIPSVLKAYLFLLDEGKEKIKLERLRKIALTSEETKPFLVNKFYEKYTHIDLVDCYGQTECCDDVLHYTIPVDTNTRAVPIGTPSLNTNIFILNHHDRLQPVGVAGEICVMGAGVGYGYWKRPGLTAEKFDRDLKIYGDCRDGYHRSYQSPMSYILYRTGDLGRWLPDGKVEYLGRVDHQVKIRGNRVELREIENHVLRYPELKEAAVVAKEDHQGEKNLYAFLVSSKEIFASEIRQYLLKTLPDYMVPAHFVSMEELPLTPNGKIDRKALLKIDAKSRLASSSRCIPPTNQYENKIREIWMQLLDRNKEQVGIHDNFFDLGGHSLMLIKLKSKLEKTFNHEVGIIELFNYPTIADQARLIQKNTKIEDKNMILPEEDREAKDMKRIETDSYPVKKDSRHIAVIGISLRVPGAKNIGEFWRNLEEGVESISFFKEEELEGSEAHRLIQGHLKLVSAGGVLGEVDCFDADFFGITPGEAEIMDPQHRLFLEHAWRGLEDAGYVGETFPGLIGIYAGVGWNIYLLNNALANPGIIKQRGEFQTMIGNDKDFFATRVSYKLNLRGPAVTVQSACSTSLAAVHLARQGLLSGECDMALAGGAAVKVPERTGYFHAEGGHLSPDGHCRPFDAKARGTVFGNGIGIVVLKRLPEAVKDNDHIYAVIKGSALNNDGSLKVGYTSPSEIGQFEVITKALREADVPAHTIGYVETHGTGTSLGDPVEIAALTRAFRTFSMNPVPDQEKKQYCAVGSVKANVGHLDVSAGIVGLIKAVLCLKHRQIPPTINVTELNPLIDFENSPFYVNRILKDWPVNGSWGPRRAGVSSLGIGGTNVHVVLEEWLITQGARVKTQGGVHKICSDEPVGRPYQLIVLSARTETTLERISRDLAHHFKQNPGINLADAAYTLQVGRKAFKYRRMLVCSCTSEAAEKLSTPGSEDLHTSYTEENKKSIVFMFPGLGSQYVNMGLGLYQSEPVFREEMNRCFEILKPLMGYDIKEILYPSIRGSGECPGIKNDRAGIHQPEIAQVVVLIIEYALSRLLMQWGIRPAAMIGYSFGEYTAALVSGVFSLEDALNLVVCRGRLISATPGGAMLSIPLVRDRLEPFLAKYNKLSTAIDNGSSCVVSGPGADVEVLEQEMKQQGYLCMRVPASYAIHSPEMDPILEEFEAQMRKIKLNNPQIPYISNVTGKPISLEEAVNPSYWCTHLRQTVRFARGLEELLKDPDVLFVEVGPGHELSGLLVRQMGKERRQPVLNLVRHPDREVSDVHFLLNKIGLLWLKGGQVDWRGMHQLQHRGRLPLPTYPFQEKSFRIKETGKGKELNNNIDSKKPDITDWFYFPQWERSQLLPMDSFEMPPGSCLLIFVDNSGLGARLKNRLAREYHDLIEIKAGAAFRKTGDHDYEMNPQQSSDYHRLMEDLQTIKRIPSVIVHLWTITHREDVEVFRNRPEETVQRSMQIGVQGLLYLAQAIVKAEFTSSIKLYTVSSHLHDIMGEEPLTPQQSPILGLLKVIPQEYTNISCRCIDIQLPEPGSPQEANLLEHLSVEFRTESIDPVVAYRMNQRWVQVFKPVRLKDENKHIPQLRPQGVYLITGGLGNIGFTLCGYLARTIKARLILTGLTPLPARSQWENYLGSGESNGSAGMKIRKIMELEKQGAEVLYIDCDAADSLHMQQKITLAEERFGPVNGVIHAAVASASQLIKSIDETGKDELITQFRPKISGLMVLEKIFRGKALDFGIIISSPSSILGGLGFAAYAAANSFLDAFVYWFNRTNPTPWFTVNWGDWLFEDSQDNDLPANPLHYLLITPEEGITTFRRMLRWCVGTVNQVVISAADLQKRINRWVRFESQQESRSRERKETRSHMTIPYAAPTNRMEKTLARIWQDYLGIEQVGIHDNFFELGATSLDIIQLNREVKVITGREIPVSTFFRFPKISQLALHLSRSTGDLDPSASAANRSAKMQSARKKLQKRVRVKRM
ncbi:MAG: amino acid adenylation domain-containing protein, partial [Candidatus Aminicenantes bacterium]